MDEPTSGVTSFGGVSQPRLRVEVVQDVQEQADVAGPSRATDAARAFADEEVPRLLEDLLAQRNFPGVDFSTLLQALVEGLQRGKFSAASNATKALVFNRMVRLRASEEKIEDAESWLQEIAAIDQEADPLAKAFLVAAKGDLPAALRALDSEGTAEARSLYFALLEKYRAAEGVSERYLFESPLNDPQRFSADGWQFVLSKLVLIDKLAQAHEVCSVLTSRQFNERPHLIFFRGLAAALELVPAERRTQLQTAGPELLAPGCLDGPEIASWRAVAVESFEEAARKIERLGATAMERACANWAQALRLTDPQSRPAEVGRFQAAMKNGEFAVQLMPVAISYDIDVDTQALETYLSRQEVFAGLTNEQRLAKAMMYFARSRWSELAAFIEKEWSNLVLVGHASAIASMLVTALVANDEFPAAEKFLDRNQAAMPADEVSRLRLMVLQARGDDPEAPAKALFEQTDSVADLNNLIVSLNRAERWTDSVPYSAKFFEREPNAKNALRHLNVLARAQAPASDILEFIEKAEPRIAKDLEISFRKAGALFRLGRSVEAREIANGVAGQRDDLRDLVMDLNLAVQSGEWERFPQILDGAWKRRAEFDAQSLLQMANVAGATDVSRAMDLAVQAVSMQPTDPIVLMNAYMLSVQLGRDRQGNVWMGAAVENQKADGPIQSYSFRQTIEVFKSGQAAWQSKLDDFRFARMPVHLAAVRFGAPLTRLLVEVPLSNVEQGDARRRTTMPFRDGRRVPMDCSTFRTVALDVTTLFHAEQLGVLDAVLKDFDCVWVASQIFRLLLEEKQKVVFHQPSRVAEAKQLLSLVAKQRLKTHSEPVASAEFTKIGDEAAALLDGAASNAGTFVHDGPIFEVDSYMDRVADIGELQKLVASPVQVVHALKASGALSAAQYGKALLELGQRGLEPAADAPANLRRLYLDRVAVGALNQCGVLGVLLNSCAEAYVYEEAVREWQALVETELQPLPSLQAIESVRVKLRDCLLTGHVKLLPPAPEREDADWGNMGMALLDVASSGGVAEFVVVDDRQLNGITELVDLRQRRVPLGCLLDILDRLVSHSLMTDEAREECLHELRKRCLYCVPLSAQSLERMMGAASIGTQGELQETAHLKTLREYLARLDSSDALCTDGDRVFQSALWIESIQAIKALWLDTETPIEKARAASSWIVENVIPPTDVAVRGLALPSERVEEVAAAHVALALEILSDDVGRQRAHSDWLNSELLARLLPANGRVLDRIAATLEASMLPLLKEVADEMAREDNA